MKDTIYINLFGGPGVGKSTLCASIFTELKKQNIDCEMALEYVKELVFEESFKKIENQIYIFGKQHNRLMRLNGKVDVVITDSPLLNSIVYYLGDNPYFKDLILYEFQKLNTINYCIKRRFNYEENGRMQTLDKAIEVDVDYKKLLDENEIPYNEIDGDFSIVNIINDIKNKYNYEKSNI